MRHSGRSVKYGVTLTSPAHLISFQRLIAVLARGLVPRIPSLFFFGLVFEGPFVLVGSPEEIRLTEQLLV